VQCADRREVSNIRLKYRHIVEEDIIYVQAHDAVTSPHVGVFLDIIKNKISGRLFVAYRLPSQTEVNQRGLLPSFVIKTLTRAQCEELYVVPLTLFIGTRYRVKTKVDNEYVVYI
jgi:hypothetical protein